MERGRWVPDDPVLAPVPGVVIRRAPDRLVIAIDGDAPPPLLPATRTWRDITAQMYAVPKEPV